MNYFVLTQITVALFTEQIVCPEHQEEVYPFLVKIEAKGKALDCAGTILTPCTVLTSAHCIEGVKPSQVTVSQITSKVIKYNVTSTVIHPKYSQTDLANDIALLQVNQSFQRPWSSVTLNSQIKETIFPKCDIFQILGWLDHIMKDPESSNTSVAGPSEKPMKAFIKLIPNENCSAAFKNFEGVFQGEEKLCGVSAEEEEEGCFTGPGGPLLCSIYSRISKRETPKKNSEFQEFQIDKNGILEDPIDLLANFQKSDDKKVKREAENEVKNLQVGVVSWGKSCSKVPSVYVKTDYYYDWIIETAKETSHWCEGYENFKITSIKSQGVTFRHSTAPINFHIFTVSITVLLRFM